MWKFAKTWAVPEGLSEFFYHSEDGRISINP
jgi:hypothetical protein